MPKKTTVTTNLLNSSRKASTILRLTIHEWVQYKSAIWAIVERKTPRKHALRIWPYFISKPTSILDRSKNGQTSNTTLIGLQIFT